MSDPLSERIQQLAQSGQHQSSGSFSLDRARVSLNFASGCDDCLHYWFRFALFYSAPQLRLEWSKREMTLSMDTPGPEPEEMHSLLLHPQLGARYLAMGALAALAQGYHKVVLDSPRGRVCFDGQSPRFYPNERLHRGCKITATHGQSLSRPRLPQLDLGGLQVLVQGQAWSPAPAPRPGLTVIVHGAELAWNGPPLIPPDVPVRFRLDQARLDLMLRQLVQPALSQEQVSQLQQQVEDQLVAAPERTLAQLEWLQLRLFAGQRWPECLRLLKAQPPPRPGQCFAAAYYERLAWLEGDGPTRERADKAWAEDIHWSEVLESGCFPPPEEDWLVPTYGQFRGRLAACAYRHALGLSGERAEADFLQALWSFRRDTLGGNYLLAGCLLRLPPARLPREASHFCSQMLQAAWLGQEATAEMERLTPEQRQRVRDRGLQLENRLQQG
jgi:hypothetical protein